MSEQWELYYWKLAGRGEYVRLVFEEAGVPYKEVADIKILLQDILPGKFPGIASLCPPVIKKGDFVLSHASVCCRYLGKLFGLYPSNPEDEWRADEINATIQEFVSEGRLVFHGKGFFDSYFTQQDETKPYLEWFKSERFQCWMGCLEQGLSLNNGGHGYVVGDKLTYVDLVLMQVLRVTESSFPETYKEQIDNFPLLKAHRARIAGRPNIQAYFNSDRYREMCGNSMM